MRSTRNFYLRFFHPFRPSITHHRDVRFMDSKFDLLIQLNGVFVITVLSLLLRRSLKLTALKYWTVAWLSLSIALICLQMAFSYSGLNTLLLTYYFLGEYILVTCFWLDAEVLTAVSSCLCETSCTLCLT